MPDLLTATLALLDGQTAERLRRARSAPLSWIDSRNGIAVPAAELDGRTVTLHSRYDPHAEAQRIADEARRRASVTTPPFAVGPAAVDGPTTICLGLGSGLHIPALQTDARAVIVIEWDAGLARAVLEQVDLRWLISTTQVSLLVAPKAGELADHLARHYHPAVDRPPVLVSLKSREAADRPGADQARAVVAEAVELLKDDVAIQGRFGRAWFRNALANLQRPQPPRPLPTMSGHSVVVTAAGPSLEQSFVTLRHRDRHVLVIATDTSAPALVEAGVRPDLVLSIDCQIASYHHALPDAVRRLPFLVDLSAPPSLVDALSDVSFYLSSHPLAQYLSMAGLPYRRLDTRSGTVTHVAVELAAALGAERILVAGADFAYPRGRTYVRESYIDRLFRCSANRYASAHSRHLRFLFDRPGLSYDRANDRYTQPLLDTYRRNLKTAGAGMSIPLLLDGTDLRDPSAAPWKPHRAEPPTRVREDAPPVTTAATTALRDLRDVIASPAALSVIAPLLTWNRARNPEMDSQLLLEATRSDVLTLIDRTLRRIADTGVADE